MKANAIKTQQEIIENSREMIRIFRNSRRREVARNHIAMLRKFKTITNREIFIQKYADVIEPFRNLRDFHSASIDGFFM